MSIRLRYCVSPFALILGLGMAQPLVPAASADTCKVVGVENTTNGGCTLDGNQTLEIPLGASIQTIEDNTPAVSGTSGGNHVILNGSVATSGFSSEGIFMDAATGGDITIRGKGSVSTSGNEAHGLATTSSSGQVSIEIGNIVTLGGAAYGIFNTAAGNVDININASDVSTSNGGAHAIGNFLIGDGNLTLNANDIITWGGGAYAIWNSITGDGTTTVNVHDVNTYSGGSKGIYNSINGTGPTIINANNVVTQGGGAFGIHNSIVGNSFTSINANNVSTQGGGAHAIYNDITGDGNTTVQVNNVHAEGGGAYGIFNNINGNGDLSVHSGDVNANIYGIYNYILNTTYGSSITIESNNITSTNVHGVYNILEGGGSISLKANDVSSNVYGVYNSVKNGGDIEVTTRDVKATNVHGIYNEISGGIGNIFTSARDVTAGVYGIYNTTSGGGNINIKAMNIEANVHGIYNSISGVGGTATVNVDYVHADIYGVYNLVSGNGSAIVDARSISAGVNGIINQINGDGTAINNVSEIHSVGYGVFNKISGSGSTETYVDHVMTDGDGGIGVFNELGSGTNSVTALNIHTLGDGASGISSFVDIGTNDVTLNGAITTQGQSAHGIKVEVGASGSNIVNNNGFIQVNGSSSYGVYLDPPLSVANILHNNGSIVSAQSYSVFFDPNGAGIFNVHAPSYIGGAMELSGLNELNVYTGGSHSVLWDFSDSPTGPIVSGSVPYFYNSEQQFATYDPSALSAAYNTLLDVADGSEFLFAHRLTQKPNSKNVWFSGFGSEMTYAGSGTATLDQSQSISIAAMGIDQTNSDGLLLGGMFGITRSTTDVNSRFAHSFDNEANGYMAGLYGQQTVSQHSWLKFGVIAGWLDHDDNRFVNDNLAQTDSKTLGISHASSGYRSWWISPSFALTHELELDGDLSLLPSIELRYAHQAIDSYTEVGSNADAAVSGRELSVGQLKAELALKKKMHNSILVGRAGYRFRQNLGDENVTIGMIGESIDAPVFFENQGAVYAGGSANIVTYDGSELRISGEAIFIEDKVGGSVTGSFHLNF